MLVLKSPLRELAARILARTEAITIYCDSVGYPHRSFALNSPSSLLPENADPKLRQEQQGLIDDISELQLLTLDTSEFLNRQAVQVCPPTRVEPALP